MKVLIISDNHGDKTILDEIKEKYQDQVDGMREIVIIMVIIQLNALLKLVMHRF